MLKGRKYMLLCATAIGLVSMKADANTIFSGPDSLVFNEQSIEGVEIKAKSRRENIGLPLQKVSEEMIRTYQSHSLSSILQSSTSLFIKSNGEGGLATPSFRGTGASHTQVLWNGIPINSQMNGSTDFSTIPVFMSDQIDLSAGSSSLKNSSGALGGSILLKTYSDWREKTAIEFLQEFGSFQTYGSFLSAVFGNQKWKSRTKLYYIQSENNFTYLNLANGEQYAFKERRKHADYRKAGFLEEIYFRPKNKQHFALKIWGNSYFRHIPTPIIVNTNNGQEQEEGESLKILFEYKEDLTPHHYVNINAGYTFDKMVYTDNRKMQDPRSEHNIHLGFLQAEYRYQKNRWSVQGGLQNHYYQAYSNHFASYKDRLQIALFGQLSYQAGPRLRVFALIREEWVDKKFRIPLPNIGSEFKLSKREEIFLSLSLAMNEHLPTLNDLYWVPGGNPNLNPEQSYLAESSLQWEKKWGKQKEWFGQAFVNLFFSNIYDWILWQPMNASVLWSPVNLKQVYSFGTEVSAKLAYSWNKKYTVRDEVTYGYTRSINQKAMFRGDASVGKQIIYVPSHLLQNRLMVSTPWIDFFWQTQFTGQRYTNSSNTEYLKAYCLNGIGIAYHGTWRKLGWEISGKLNNLFNVAYESAPWQPMPGRNFQIGIKGNFIQ